MSTTDSRCRACGSEQTTIAGEVEYFQGFRWTVRDCAGCGCRFTPHDAAVHDQFHAAPALSYYREYAELMERCRALFQAGDRPGLERELRASAKYRFVIDRAATLPNGARLLEVGCSRGYLTSHFILAGRCILGADVSPEAIAGARRAFGDHFAVWGSPAIDANGPYDLIYHVGLIGCVADPIGLTRDLLNRLAPGGRLIFNAPNRNALYLPAQLWMDSAPPPDLVTLFPQGFWARQFSPAVTVDEDVEMLTAEQSWRRAVLARLGSWTPSVPQPMTVLAHEFRQPPGGARGLAVRALSAAGRMTGLDRVAKRRPTEFGLFVTMTKADA